MQFRDRALLEATLGLPGGLGGRALRPCSGAAAWDQQAGAKPVSSVAGLAAGSLLHKRGQEAELVFAGKSAVSCKAVEKYVSPCACFSLVIDIYKFTWKRGKQVEKQQSCLGFRHRGWIPNGEEPLSPELSCGVPAGRAPGPWGAGLRGPQGCGELGLACQGFLGPGFSPL